MKPLKTPREGKRHFVVCECGYEEPAGAYAIAHQHVRLGWKCPACRRAQEAKFAWRTP